MVAERILRIPQSDLTKVRVTCLDPKCGKVAELSVEQAATQYIGGDCPFCNKELVPAASSGAANPFTHLRTAWDAFKARTSNVAVDFVIAES